MQRAAIGRHLADKRAPSLGGRVRNFMRIARMPRETFHVHRAPSTGARIVQFMRIARGKLA